MSESHRVHHIIPTVKHYTFDAGMTVKFASRVGGTKKHKGKDID